MGHLLGPPLLEGNKITALENGDQIFPAMLGGIRSARRTISFENFLFHEGEVSDAFVEALAERARNGLKVHFLQDALGCDAVQGGLCRQIFEIYNSDFLRIFACKRNRDSVGIRIK